MIDFLKFIFFASMLFGGFLFFLYELSVLIWGNWCIKVAKIPEEIQDIGLDFMNKNHRKYLNHPYIILQITYLLWTLLSFFTFGAVVTCGLLILGFFNSDIKRFFPKYPIAIDRVDAFLSAFLIAAINYFLFFENLFH